MDPGFVFLIVFGVIILLIGMSVMGGNSSQGLYSGGNKKGKLGVVGLVVALFAILGLSNYFQTVM